MHVEINQLKSSKKASQFEGQPLTLKSETDTVTISLIIPRKDSLNKKTQEVNNRLRSMCGEREITCVDHADTIDIERHLNDSKVP